MHSLFQEQIDKYASFASKKKKKKKSNYYDYNFDQGGNFVAKGLFVGYENAIKELPAPWQGDGSCYNMIIPNIAVNIGRIPDWEEEITQTPEFEEITSLVIGGDVRDFSFVPHFANLSELYIYTYNEEDGRHVYPCEDWGFLAELENLNYLVAMGCPYFDTAPLRALWEKQRANRRAAKAAGEDPLFMPALDHLILHTCNITDLSDFAATRYIHDCNLSHNNISDLTPILNVGFYYLNLRYNKLTSLPDLRVEYHLNVRHNEITQIPDWCADLSRFFTAHNPIEEIPDWLWEYAQNQYFVDDDLGELFEDMG